MAKAKKRSSEYDREIVVRYQDGEGVEQLSRAYRMTTTAVRGIVAAAGIPLRRALGTRQDDPETPPIPLTYDLARNPDYWLPRERQTRRGIRVNGKVI